MGHKLSVPNTKKDTSCTKTPQGLAVHTSVQGWRVELTWKIIM